jgi:bacillithiol biosynthesis deacetylase BshB1
MKKSKAVRASSVSAKAPGAPSAGVDFMAVAAHPDDAELFGAGTFLKMRAYGRTGVLVDVTDGGAGTRGTAAIRAKEATAAAKVLGMTRVCLGEPDGRVRNTLEAQWKLIAAIRRFRPKVIFTHHFAEEHPDHGAVAAMVKEATFRAGLTKLDCEGAPFRPGRIYYSLQSASSVTPTFCVDVSAVWATKLRVIRCYESQFHNAARPSAMNKFAGKTDLATPAFLEAIEVRGRFYGQRIRRRYAEAFWCEELAEVADPSALGLERFP